MLRNGPKEVSIRPWRYARVNICLTTLDDCIKAVQALGYSMSTIPMEEGMFFCIDEHIPNLLVFSPGTDLVRTQLYKTGHLILQDKASCIPAVVLAPPANSIVADSCSAPGNKTTHLAALVGASGHVFAFERDPKRFLTLTDNLKKHGCIKVIPECKDFLRIRPADYAKVEYALVDPSCSGSGMLDSYENADSKENADRLKTLANFQCMILRHAMKCKKN